MILKYQKITDRFTTHTFVEPDYQDGDERITELCTIGNDTYLHVPDSVVLPEQAFNIDVTTESVVLTDELKIEIKALSPHVRLINDRVVDKIREKYSLNDEMKMHREYVQSGSTPAGQAYLAYIAVCRAWGHAEKSKIGLG